MYYGFSASLRSEEARALFVECSLVLKPGPVSSDARDLLAVVVGH